MKSSTRLYLAIPCLLAVAAGCSTTDTTLRIASTEVLGATFIVCKSQVKWDGSSFSIEGLERSNETINKKFIVGKLDYKPIQVRELNNMGVAISSFYLQMCQNSLLLKGDSKALASYIDSQSDAANQVFAAILEMERIQKKAISPEEAIAEQGKALPPVVQRK